MYCIQADIPNSLCKIDDELKAIYHSKDSICIWVFAVSYTHLTLPTKA